MRRKLARSVPLLFLAAGIVLGCHKPLVQQKVPPDPLLVSKKPIEGKLESGEPIPPTRIDPQPPPLPRRMDPPPPSAPEPGRSVQAPLYGQ